MNLYYKIWIDCILIMKNKEGNWKINSLLVMSLLTTLNSFACIIIAISIWNKCIQNGGVLKLPKIDFVYFLVLGFLIYILNFLVHYFLIFYSKKYIRLFNGEEQVTNGLLSKYFIISGLGLLFIYFLVKVII